MNELVAGERSLTLNRFPANAAGPGLQAWDSADEYLLQQELPAGPLLMLNDTFGALSCGLQPREIWHVSDSWISQQAARQNLTLNMLDKEQVTFFDSLQPLPQAPAAVLIKIPRTLALLEHQLQAIRGVISADTPVIAAAKAKDIHNSTLALFEKVIGQTRTSPAWKKSRLVFSQLTQTTYIIRSKR